MAQAVDEKKSDDQNKTIFPDPNKIETTMMKAKRTHKSVQGVVHEVDWSGIFDEKQLPNKTNWKFSVKNKKKLEKGKDAWTIPIFSPTESAKLIELCELYGFEDCGYPKHYRSNTRMITDDPALIQQLYERVKLCCPKVYNLRGTKWEMYGLNPRIRWCKYVKDQLFGAHCDAQFVVSGTDMSLYTVNVFLNDGAKDFKGGRTRFYSPKKKDKFAWDVSSAAVATPGLAVMFNQYPDNIRHDGEVVTEGVKYLMRTDVMYRVKE